MLYTTGQLRSAFSLSKQQWRSYREALSPLAKDQGRSACFTASDLLATRVVNRLSTSLSIPLSVFTEVAEPLFGLLAAHPWPQLERSNLLIDVEGNRVELVENEHETTDTAVGLLVELAPLVADLRQHLLVGEPDPQGDLAFPPMVAGAHK